MKKKIYAVIPMFILFACGEAENVEDTTENKVEEKIEEVVVAEPNYSEDIKNYMTEKGLEGKETETGLFVVIENPGKGGEKPSSTDDVTIHYKGYLLDGTQFDGTEDAPASFPLNQLILGWQEGIPHFSKGGKGKLIIPPFLGYGDRQVGDIPPNSILVFDIELLDFAPSTGNMF